MRALLAALLLVVQEPTPPTINAALESELDLLVARGQGVVPRTIAKETGGPYTTRWPEHGAFRLDLRVEEALVPGVSAGSTLTLIAFAANAERLAGQRVVLFLSRSVPWFLKEPVVDSRGEALPVDGMSAVATEAWVVTGDRVQARFGDETDPRRPEISLVELRAWLVAWRERNVPSLLAVSRSGGRARAARLVPGRKRWGTGRWAVGEADLTKELAPDTWGRIEDALVTADLANLSDLPGTRSDSPFYSLTWWREDGPVRCSLTLPTSASPEDVSRFLGVWNELPGAPSPETGRTPLPPPDGR